MVGGETMLQVPDSSAEVMTAEVFRRELDRRGPFYDSIHRYAQALLTLLMQSSGCLALHPVHERCCRWLLMTHDRVHRDDFHLSHEFLAMMLGSTRPTVSTVAGMLQKAGLITYTYGHITILDRPGLEAGACECYSTVKAHYDRLRLWPATIRAIDGARLQNRSRVPPAASRRDCSRESHFWPQKVAGRDGQCDAAAPRCCRSSSSGRRQLVRTRDRVEGVARSALQY